MEQKELIKLWANELIEKLQFAEDDPTVYSAKFMAIVDYMHNVYDVGFEAGKDAQKLEIQLQQHGKPYGNIASWSVD